jgi:hypothetical protein
MLHALLRNKPGPGHRAADDDEGRGWGGVTRLEDPLTSAVFGRLAYLDTPALWSLLRDASEEVCGGALPAAAPSGAPTWRLWPHLPPGRGGEHARYVEPDVVVAWDSTVLVVEAKHRGGQYAWEWAEQILAAQQHFPAGTSVWLLAVGGTNPVGEREALARDERGVHDRRRVLRVGLEPPALTSAYVARPVASTRTRASALKTRQGRPPSAARSSAPIAMASAACSGVPPAIAKTSPRNHSCRVALAASAATSSAYGIRRAGRVIAQR